MRRSAAALLLLIATSGVGRADCVHTAARFRARVRSVRMLSEGAKDVYVVDLDPQFAVVLDVVSVAKGVTEPRRGQRLTFGIHSPARTFVSSKEVSGRTFDLEAERVDCNGKFSGYAALRRALP